MDTDFELRQAKAMWQPQPIDPQFRTDDFDEKCVCDCCYEVVDEIFEYGNQFYCLDCLQEAIQREADKELDEEEEAALVDFEGAVGYLKY